MATTIKRLVDGVLLPALSKTALQLSPDAFGSSRTQTLSMAGFGEAIQLGSTLNLKDFTLLFLSTDTTGVEQNKVRKFFNSSEPYEISSDEFGISKIWATVNEIEVGWDRISVSVTSRYGDLVNQTSVLLGQATSNAVGNIAAFTCPSWTNSTPYDAKLQVTLEAETVGSWQAPMNINVTTSNSGRALYFRAAAQNDLGQWNVNQRRKSIIFDSSRLILGSGYFAANTIFWRQQPNSFTGTISVAAIIAVPRPTTIKIEAVYLEEA